MNTNTRATRTQWIGLRARWLAALAILAVASGHAMAQGASGHQLTFQAYQQALKALTTALQQSDRSATQAALIPVLAVNRSLTRGLDRDRARLTAASRIVELGDGPLVLQLADATMERMTQALSATSWVATGDNDHRTDALANVQAAIDKTQAAVAGMTSRLTQIQGLTLPPALVVNVDTSRNANGVFVLLVNVDNVGDTAAPSVTLTLTNGDSIGGGTQEVTFGALPPGGKLQHVFAVSIPGGAAAATASVEASAPNATPDLFVVDFDLGTP